MPGSVSSQRSTDWVWRSAFATVALMLSACGGSGGGETAPTPPAPAPAPAPTPPAPAPAPTPPAPTPPAPAPAARFDVAAALEKVYSAGFAKRTVTGSTTALSASQDWTMTLQTDEVFEGVSRKVILKDLSTTVTVTSTGNRATVAQNYKVYFSTAPFQIHGSAFVGTSAGITVTSQRAALPSSAALNQTGDFYSSASYTNSTKATVIATSVVTWSIEPDGDSTTTAFACLNETSIQVSAPTVENKSSECYRIDPAGNLLGVVSRVTVTDPSGALIVITLR